MAGLDATGLTILSEDEIRTELQNAYRAAYGESVNVTPESRVGASIEVWVAREKLLWQAIQASFDASFINGAFGVSLDDQGLLVGQTRDRATRSTVELTVTLDAAITLPAGSQAKATGSNTVFQTTFEVTSTTSGDYVVDAEATTTGPLVAGANTITEIVTPVTGWTAVDNVSAADPGRNEQTDTDFRNEIIAAAAAQPGSTNDGIRTALLQVLNVTAATVTSNRTDVTVGSLTPHSFEAVVEGGTDQDVAQAIADNYPAGVETIGTVTVQIPDSEGVLQDINFSRATQLQVYCDVTYEVLSGVIAGDTITPVKEAISDYTGTLAIGQALHVSELYPVVFDVGGIDRITALTIGTSPSPTGDEVIPASDEKVSIDVADIAVTAS